MRIAVILLLTIISQLSQSQIVLPALIPLQQDTALCFTTDQGRQLVTWNEERKVLVQLNEINETKLYNDSLSFVAFERMLDTKDSINAKQSVILATKDEQFQIMELKYEDANKEAKRQRRLKNIFIGLGGVIAMLGIMY